MSPQADHTPGLRAVAEATGVNLNAARAVYQRLEQGSHRRRATDDQAAAQRKASPKPSSRRPPLRPAPEGA
jgi:DNA-binding transcriptional regulator YhcF (GntR family)